MSSSDNAIEETNQQNEITNSAVVLQPTGIPDDAASLSSAVLQQQRNEDDYCPSCGEKADSKLCSKCANTMICPACEVKGYCSKCVIECEICLLDGVRGDFIAEICQSCEDHLSAMDGTFTDGDGEEHSNLVEVLFREITGEFVTSTDVQQSFYEYLTHKGIDVKDPAGE